MGRLALLSGLAAGVLLLGLAALDGGIVALAVPLVVYLAAALLYSPERPRLRASRTVSASHIRQGQPVKIHLTVVNEGPQLEEVRLLDCIVPPLELLDGQTSALTALPPGGKVELNYTVRGRRSIFTFHDVQAIATGPLGLFQRRVHLRAPAQLFILPASLRLHPLKIRPPRTRSFAGPIPARQGGAGINFFGVRDYKPGDPLRWINWKAHARHGRALFTTEFEQERVADVGLILDARRQTDVQMGGESLFEHSVQAAAALAQAFLDDGNRVGLLVYGRGQQATFPGYGKLQGERILRALAEARTGDNIRSLSYLPARFFPSRSQIVMISPLNPGDLPVLTRLRAYGYQILVVSPDPVTFEARWLEPHAGLPLAVRIARLERLLLLRKLQRVGVQVIDWQVDQPLDRALHHGFSRMPKEFRTLGGQG